MPVHFRPAIAMVELIFAIVILGIVLMGAPTLIGVSQKASESLSYQESIVQASSTINLITTHFWDENDFNNSSPILASAANQFPGRVDREDTDSSVFLPPTNIGAASDINPLNDMDDFDDKNYTVGISIAAEVSISGISDYLDFTVTIATQVRYGKAVIDEPFSGILGGLTVPVHSGRDTKVISVTLTSPNFEDKDITLSTFACNIGSFNIPSTGMDR